MIRERKDAVELIHRMLGYDYKADRSSCWHIGRLELRQLMDFIYGEEPQSDEERVQGL